jgi:anti-sigma regulatory factor (Ser/Thr protein kinase)
VTRRVQGEFRGPQSGFAALRGFVEAFGRTAGVSARTTERLVLVLEELFTNTVTYGYCPSGEGPVWLTLETRADRLEVVYEDAAAPFDPFARPLDAGAGAPPEASASGGLGLALVRGLSSSVRYARTGGRNRIVIVMAVEGRSGQSPRASR